MGTIVGEYEVNAILGHGGFSVVYRARHVETGRIVALKEYFPADLSVRDSGTVLPRSSDCAPHYEDGRRRFLEEARSVIQFADDPGVVTCLGYFRANSTAYLVLEHVEGMSLATLLRQREAAGRPLDEGELRSLILPLLETLSRLHEADVLHRDIKPSNILVRRSDGSPVLIDFGAAKQQAALHSKSSAPFTEGYAALEQVAEGELGSWTDIYAIGAIMWRVVAGGMPPWDPPNPKKVELRASAVLTGSPDPLPTAVELGRGRFSRELLEMVDRCLLVPASERIHSCKELISFFDEGDPESKEISTLSRTQSPNSPPPTESSGGGYMDNNAIDQPQSKPKVYSFFNWCKDMTILVALGGVIALFLPPPVNIVVLGLILIPVLLMAARIIIVFLGISITVSLIDPVALYESGLGVTFSVVMWIVVVTILYIASRRFFIAFRGFFSGE